MVPDLSLAQTLEEITTPTLMAVDGHYCGARHPYQLCQLVESSIYVTTRPLPQPCRVKRSSGIPLSYSTTCRMMSALEVLVVLGLGFSAAATASPALTARSATNVCSPFIVLRFALIAPSPTSVDSP